MATFYGGEQLSQLVRVVETGNLSEFSRDIIYTVPTGFYAIVEFAWAGSNLNWSNIDTSIEYRLHAQHADDISTLYNAGRSIKPAGRLQENFGDRRNLFFDAGTRFYRVNDTGNSHNVRGELILRLYKKP